MSDPSQSTWSPRSHTSEKCLLTWRGSQRRSSSLGRPFIAANAGRWRPSPLPKDSFSMAAPTWLITWRRLLSVFIGAAHMPVSHRNLAHRLLTAEGCSCIASLAAHFRLQRNRPPVAAAAAGQKQKTCECTAGAEGHLHLFRSRNVLAPVFFPQRCI